MRIMTNVQPVTEIWKMTLNKRRYQQHQKRYQKSTKASRKLPKISYQLMNESRKSKNSKQGRHSQQTSGTKQNEISGSNQYITKINAEIEKLRTENVTDDSAKLNKEQKTLKNHEKQKESLIDKRSYYDIAGYLLQDSGIKTKIIRQYLPIMNKLINKYLASMDFFVQFELDEGFNETIKSRYRDAFSYANFSEGEKMRIDLALLFTWRAVAKLKNSVNTNLLVLDEVFDSSLDESGTDEFLKILHTLDKDTNTFIISHKGDILTEKFRHTMTFEKVKNFSRIVNSK